MARTKQTARKSTSHYDYFEFGALNAENGQDRRIERRYGASPYRRNIQMARKSTGPTPPIPWAGTSPRLALSNGTKMALKDPNEEVTPSSGRSQQRYNEPSPSTSNQPDSTTLSDYSPPMTRRRKNEKTSSRPDGDGKMKKKK